MIDHKGYEILIEELSQQGASLVAVSKTHPIETISHLYDWGQRHFGENRSNELVEKAHKAPSDIMWHFIGHLQSKKAKDIASFVDTINAVDSEKLLRVIDKEAGKHDRQINCLLQLKIAQEDKKYGFSYDELIRFLDQFSTAELPHINLRGLMGMATYTSDHDQVRSEFSYAQKVFDEIKFKHAQLNQFDTLSLGMTGDYKVALECGSTMVRIGSLLFGDRI